MDKKSIISINWQIETANKLNILEEGYDRHHSALYAFEKRYFDADNTIDGFRIGFHEWRWLYRLPQPDTIGVIDAEYFSFPNSAGNENIRYIVAYTVTLHPVSDIVMQKLLKYNEQHAGWYGDWYDEYVVPTRFSSDWWELKKEMEKEAVR